MYRYDIQSPSLLLVDNFECHVSKTSEEMLANELISELCPLPPNTTSVCQPLDVGVMGPFKAKMRKHWLCKRTTFTSAHTLLCAEEVLKPYLF